MDTGIHKSLRRQDITFEEKDQSLRDDVRTLGAMVGEPFVGEKGTRSPAKNFPHSSKASTRRLPHS